MENLRVIVPENFKEVGKRVNEHINSIRNTDYDYVIKPDLVRFSNGEGKCVLEESVREQDVYILTDVGNYDITYKTIRGTHHMMPDEHCQDLKRIISSMNGHAKRITLVMPMLYSSRQDKRSLRESLDCAMFLQDMERVGVKEIVSFDIHNPIVANAIPNMPLSNAYATGELLISMLTHESVNLDNVFIVGPDGGARNKAKFVADILGGTRYGNFDKRRDYSKIVDGGSPIEYHEFVGPDDLSNTDIIVVDDMIASGSSLLDTAKQLKSRGAKKIYLMTTFALFTKGVEDFDKAYEDGLFDRVYSTNLTYVPLEYKEREWYRDVDLSYKIASIITNLNEGKSIRELLNGKEATAEKIKRLVK